MAGIMVELILWSDNPETPIDYIRKSIDIIPDDQETLGSIKYYGEFKQLNRIVEASSLLYSTGYIDTIEVEDAATKMIEILDGSINKIKKLMDQYELNAKFCIVINIEQNPIILLPPNFIKIVSNLSAEIEFDMYINKSNRFFKWLNRNNKN